MQVLHEGLEVWHWANEVLYLYRKTIGRPFVPNFVQNHTEGQACGLSDPCVYAVWPIPPREYRQLRLGVLILP